MESPQKECVDGRNNSYLSCKTHKVKGYTAMLYILLGEIVSNSIIPCLYTEFFWAVYHIKEKFQNSQEIMSPDNSRGSWDSLKPTYVSLAPRAIVVPKWAPLYQWGPGSSHVHIPTFLYHMLGNGGPSKFHWICAWYWPMSNFSAWKGAQDESVTRALPGPIFLNPPILPPSYLHPLTLYKALLMDGKE